MTRESTNTPFIVTFGKWKMESNSLQPLTASVTVTSAVICVSVFVIAH